MLFLKSTLEDLRVWCEQGQRRFKSTYYPVKLILFFWFLPSMFRLRLKQTKILSSTKVLQKNDNYKPLAPIHPQDGEIW